MAARSARRSGKGAGCAASPGRAAGHRGRSLGGTRAPVGAAGRSIAEACVVDTRGRSCRTGSRAGSGRVDGRRTGHGHRSHRRGAGGDVVGDDARRATASTWTGVAGAAELVSAGTRGSLPCRGCVAHKNFERERDVHGLLGCSLARDVCRPPLPRCRHIVDGWPRQRAAGCWRRHRGPGSWKSPERFALYSVLESREAQI